MINETLSREHLYQALHGDVDSLIEEAKSEKVDLPTFLNRKSPVPSKAYPEDAVSDLLARENLVISATSYQGTSSIEDFMKSDTSRMLFWTVLDRDYDRTLRLDEIADVSSIGNLQRDANTSAQTTQNTPFNPSTTMMLRERHRFMPKIRIVDIAGGMDTISGISFEQPQYTTSMENEKSVDIPEGGPIPVTTIKFANVKGRTKKYGGGIRWSDEFALEMTNLSLLRMWARRRAMRDEIKIVNEGLAAALNVAGAAHDIDLGAGALTVDDILELALFDGGDDPAQNPNEDNGYQITAVFGVKDVVKRLMQGYLAAGTPGFLSQYPDMVFTNFWNAVELINSGLGGPTRLGLVRQNAVAPSDTLKVDSTTALGLDTRFALTLQQTARGMKTEDMRIGREQVMERYITKRTGWMVSDPEAVVNIGV